VWTGTKGSIHFPDQLVACALLSLLLLFGVVGDNVLLEASIALADHALGGRELAGALLNAHVVVVLVSSRTG